uniref:Uncharacterized protein n=1 Tax=Amphimedon queenslandica TaxID=400682 RepID=A0A1X7UJN9_AMPQE
MVFSKKSCIALFLSCLILSVQAKTDCHDGKRKSGGDELFYNVIGVVPVEAAAAKAPLVVSGLGFTAGGLATNSIGASIMSAMGANVAIGGVVATLQSVGAVGRPTMKEKLLFASTGSLLNAVNDSSINYPVQANTSCPDGCKEEKEESGYNYWLIGAAAVGGGVVAVATAPVIISGLGFTAGGIAANSIAASMMSAWGPTAAGGVVSTLQSAGVIGLSVGAKVGIGAVGAVIGAAVGTAATKLQSNGTDDN